LSTIDVSKAPSTSDSSNEFNTGKWRNDEHCRFIEGLQRHGKDWQRVQ